MARERTKIHTHRLRILRGCWGCASRVLAAQNRTAASFFPVPPRGAGNTSARHPCKPAACALLSVLSTMGLFVFLLGAVSSLVVVFVLLVNFINKAEEKIQKEYEDAKNSLEEPDLQVSSFRFFINQRKVANTNCLQFNKTPQLTLYRVFNSFLFLNEFTTNAHHQSPILTLTTPLHRLHRQLQCYNSTTFPHTSLQTILTFVHTYDPLHDNLYNTA